MAPLVVVFGGGSVGNAVARVAIEQGKRVRIATRSGRGELPKGADAVKADAGDASSVKSACDGAASVIFCAAPPYTDWPAQYPKMQAGVLEGAAAAGARLVTAENVYVYGRTEAPLTEDSPWRPTSKKGELRATLNRQLLEAHKAGKAQVALGRAPDYYGPRATANTIYGEQVYPKALAGKAANVFGDLDALHTFIFVDDLARGLLRLADEPSSMGEVWHLPCPPPLTQRAMLEIIYAAAGHPMKARAMPKLVLSALALFSPIMRELSEMEYQWRMPYDFRHAKFDAAFPGHSVTPHEKAVASTLSWFKEAAGDTDRRAP